MPVKYAPVEALKDKIDEISFPSVFALSFASRVHFLVLNKVCVFHLVSVDGQGIGRPALASAKGGPRALLVQQHSIRSRADVSRPIWSRRNRQTVDHSLRGCSCPLRPRLDLSDCGWAMVAPIGNPDHLAANV